MFACSTDSVQVHLAWQNTDSSDEAEGLGVVAPFPLLGDKTQRLCRWALLFYGILVSLVVVVINA